MKFYKIAFKDFIIFLILRKYYRFKHFLIRRSFFLFRLIKRFYNKLNRLIYRKGYTIHFDKLCYEPNFSQYDLKGIGTWLLTKGNQWICTSEITDKEKFSKIFFEKNRVYERRNNNYRTLFSIHRLRKLTEE